MTRIVAGMTAVIALFSACGGDEQATPTERREEAASALEDAPLREDEAPDGLEPSDRGTGPIESVREILPPRQFSNLTPIPVALARAFQGGFEVAYDRAGGEEGLASAASSAIRFADEGTASGFMSYFREVHVGAGRDPERAEFPVTWLGDEGFGWHQEEPLAESSTVVWRSGNLVRTVTLSGPIGAATPDRALALARRMEARLPSAQT
ncbi:MAG: hypothetical protein ACRDHB_08520 [Actinomycetota bacterium]